MDAEEDLQPHFTIKKRAKKPRPSTSSIRSFSSAQGDDTPTAAAGNGADAQDGADEDGNVAVVRVRGKKTPAGRVRDREAGKSKSRMWFGGDEEDGDDGETSFVKRSSPASTPRRLLRPSSGLPSPAAASSTSSLSTPSAVLTASQNVYSKAYLEDLKRSQLSTPRGAAAVAADGEAGGYDDLTKSKFGADQLDASSISTIPTTAAISLAKQRREEMRKAGVNPASRGDGFVSLDVGFANKGGESRLVREEDELGDGDEDLAAYTGADTRLPLGKRANAAAAAQLRAEMGEMIEDVEMDVRDDDEEMREWEEAQIRRAGGAQEAEKADKKEDGRKGVYRPAPIPQTSTLPSLASTTSRLAAMLSMLTTSHQLDSSSLAHFEKERQDLDTQEKELREEVQKVEKKSRWFDELKEEVEDWGAFLDEKFPQLEKIEYEYLAIQGERFDIVSRRRYADDADDVALFTGANVPSVFRTASSDASAAPIETDEEEQDLQPRSQARNVRRAEREGRSSSASTSAYPDPIDSAGYLSDSALSPTQSTDLSAALASLHESLTSLFSDVKAPPFRDPSLGILQRFEEWRTTWKEEYAMMFAGLSLGQVWEFWARVEMAGWNPFEIQELPHTSADLSAYSWHKALSSYGHSPSDSNPDDLDEEEADESIEVVNAIVASVIVPRLSALAKVAYDPFSSRQTVAALRLVDEISYCVETNSPKFENLVLSFLSRLRLAVAQSQSLILPYQSSLSLPSLAYDPTTFIARLTFLHRQLKLIRTCSRWRRYMRALRVQAVPETFETSGGETVDVETGAGATFDELVQRELVARAVLPVVEILEALPKDIPPALRRRLEGAEVAQR
ncbi:GC-rich sequence DNA-binding factor [Rhodotorula toruloides]|uniref:GC-rich sequence DNA-binding factor n=1 Tax=Rhodotorula toruloides TaxID=5286 RepID=A0A511KJV2_RHOTO|nr:GC-rich sequence DNA-binding factor [Rhodotorula toruloides]